MMREEGECEESDVWCGRRVNVKSDVWCGRRVNVKRVMCGVGGG